MRSSPRWPWVLIVAAGATCAEVDLPEPDPVLPERYRETYVEARGCQATALGHELGHAMVRVAPEVAPRYQGGPFPFPVGTLIVLEQYADARCTDLTGWAVMKKEAAGYDAANGDWSWYRLDPRQRILEQGRIARCTACHQECQARDLTCAGPQL